jgi:hypothetical protein
MVNVRSLAVKCPGQLTLPLGYVKGKLRDLIMKKHDMHKDLVEKERCMREGSYKMSAGGR